MISSVVLDAFVVEFMMNFIRSREAGCFADMLAMAREICEELIDIGGLDSEATHLFRFPVELWSGSDYEASVLTCVAAGMRRAGQPFGISEESDRIFQVIAPKSGALENTSGAAADFGFHTDNAALPPQFHPQSIALTCMHNDAHAETGVVSVDEIFTRLAPPLRAVAAQSRFRHVMPPSFGEACGRHRFGPSARPNDITLTRKNGAWFVSVTLRVPEDACARQRTGNALRGVDFGINDWATFDDGSTISNPRWVRTELPRLAALQRQRARKKKGRKVRCASIAWACAWRGCTSASATFAATSCTSRRAVWCGDARCWPPKSCNPGT